MKTGGVRFIMKYVMLFVLCICVSTNAFAEQVELRSGTAIVVMLTDTVSTDTHKTGQDIGAIVTSNVYVNGKIVVEAGAAVIVNIAHARGSGAIGKGGELTVQVTGVYAVDGTLIPVTGSKTVAGDDETTATVVVGVMLCPLALLNEGDKADIAANAQIRTISLGSVKIEPKP